MSEQDIEKWYSEIISDFPPYLEGAIHDAWERCLPVWREKGRIEDYPLGIRYTSYMPWWGKFLAYEFVGKFRDDYPFLIPFLSSDEEFLQICAVELLGYLCCQYGDQTVPDELLSLRQSLPKQIKTEIECDYITRGKSIETVGDLFRFQLSGDE
jgi:hypothetical protein